MNKTIIIIAVIVIAAIVIFSFLSNSENKKNKSDTTVQNISAKEFQQQKEQQPGIVIDVRTQGEYEEGHLAETDQHHDLLNGDFKAQIDSLDKDETYYLYCRSGNRSGQAAKMMVEKGFENVYNIGGYEDLVSAGLENKRT